MKARRRFFNFAKVSDADVQNLARASSRSLKLLKETIKPRSVTFISAQRTLLMNAVR